MIIQDLLMMNWRNQMQRNQLKEAIRNIIEEQRVQRIVEAAKDDMRINDMLKKAAGDDEKLNRLARNMAKSIKDGQKAAARGKAAEEIIGKDSMVAKIFNGRAKELGWVFSKNPDMAGKGKGYIFLPTDAAMTLWDNEIVGQLSDGAWENSKPWDHWKFWGNLDVKKGSPQVKGGGWARRTGYNLHSLISVIGDRMINMARLAKAIGKPLTYDQARAAEYLPDTPEEFAKAKIPSYVQAYMKKLKKSDIKKYYETSYGKSELNNDLKYIKKAMSSAA